MKANSNKISHKLCWMNVSLTAFEFCFFYQHVLECDDHRKQHGTAKVATPQVRLLSNNPEHSVARDQRLPSAPHAFFLRAFQNLRREETKRKCCWICKREFLKLVFAFHFTNRRGKGRQCGKHHTTLPELLECS